MHGRESKERGERWRLDDEGIMDVMMILERGVVWRMPEIDLAIIATRLPPPIYKESSSSPRPYESPNISVTSTRSYFCKYQKMVGKEAYRARLKGGPQVA